MNLYMIQIGFRLDGMNTEGHDTLFAIASSKEEAFVSIKKARPYAHHIDTCLEVHHADGYDVRVTAAPQPSEQKLWFINLGGFRPGQFGEVHKCILIVAPSLQEAKTKAKQDPFFKEEGLTQDPKAAPHIDDKHLIDPDEGIDDVLCVSEQFGLELVQSDSPKENALTIQYIPF